MRCHESEIPTIGGTALAAAMTVWIVTVAAQQPPQPTPPAAAQPATNQSPARGGGAPPGGAPAAAPAARVAVPAAASSIAAKPEASTASTSPSTRPSKRHCPAAFPSIRTRAKSTGKEVVVLAPACTSSQPNTYVTVIGEVVTPTPARLPRSRGRRAGPAGGRPREVSTREASDSATPVINGSFNDSRKFIPPDDPRRSGARQGDEGVGAANGALRKGVDAANVELVKTNTAILAKAFRTPKTFWKARRTPKP